MKTVKYSALILISALAFVASCKKSEQPGPPGGGTPAEKVKDTTLLYSRDIYLWYDQIPASFNARSYADPDAIMQAIRNYSNEPGYTSPVDRWSFAYDKDAWDDVSSGVTSDFGINVFFRQESDLRVRFVEENSPAGQAGIQRGWRITKINGNSNITTANANFISQAVYGSNTINIEFEKPDGSPAIVDLQTAVYQSQPIILDSVYTVNGRKTGYLVFNSFLGDTTAVFNEFTLLFARFAQENIEELVVDLRYNGGGYVNVQNRLANFLIPFSADGQVMMRQQYNDKYSIYDQTTRFQKNGFLDLSRIFFIVSNNTASASELLINNLKPYMDVKVVGPSDTYGKPVGYFPIPVGDWYIFPVSFRSVNKNGDGSYFSGLARHGVAADGLDKNWGDDEETSLASVFNYLTNGTFRTARMQTVSPNVSKTNDKFDAKRFKGMVETRD